MDRLTKSCKLPPTYTPEKASAPSVPGTPAPNETKPDIGRIQGELRALVGSDRIRQLHAESLPLDLLVSLLPLAALAASFWAVGLADLPWIARLTLSLVIAWLLTLNGLVAHDLCVHRLRWGRNISWLQRALAFGLLTTSGTSYLRTHIQHHAHIGTPRDTEAYKQDLTTSWRRFAFCTVVGIKLVRSGRWSNPRRKGYYDTGAPSPVDARHIRQEKLLAVGMVIAMVVYAALDPLRVLMGYALPIVIFAPILNTLRIIIEHGEADSVNPYALGTNYRTGFFSKLFFLADSGDCHLVHHVFPRMPCYRVPAAVREFAPFFAGKGVVERHSYLGLLKGWFVHSHPHRSSWPAA